jgi:hypothetical protein
MNLNSIVSSSAVSNFVNKKGVQRVLSDLGNESKLLPILLIEVGGLTGRSYHAQKRGGYYEFKETLLEGALAAAVWMCGIKVLNKVADALLKNIAKIDTSVDWKQLPNMAKGRIDPDKFLKTTYAAKFAKLAFSVGVSIYTVGALIPKYKQRLTKESIERKKKAEAANPAKQKITFSNNQKPSLVSDYNHNAKIELPQNITAAQLNNIAKSPINNVRFTGNKPQETISNNQLSFTGNKPQEKISNNQPSFTGLIDVISKVGFALENQAIPQLAVNDLGITGGRIINARNNDEAVEIFFRDMVSSMFYYFCIPFFSITLASMFDKKLGIHTKLDPKSLNPVTEAFQQRIFEIARANKGVIGIDDIQKALLGTQNEAVFNSVKNALMTSANQQMSPQQLQALLNNTDDILAKALAQTANASKEQIVKQVQVQLAEISKRAVVVAQNNANQATSSAIRNMSNLLDDLAKTGGRNVTDVKQIAKTVQEISNKAYAQVQGGKGLDQNIIKEIEKAITALSKTNLDESLLGRVKDSFKAIQASSASTGYITKEALEELVKGGLSRDKNFISRILTGIRGSAVTDPTRYISPAEHKQVQETITTYAKRLLGELDKTESIVYRFQKLAGCFLPGPWAAAELDLKA